jgi:hypothetical protein
MLAAVLHSLLGSALALAGWLPRVAHRSHAPVEEDRTLLWAWMDDHGDVVFPLMGLAIIGLLFLGIRHGMQSSGDEMKRKMHDKDEIVRMMRSRLLLNADEVCKHLKIDRLRAAALLEELLVEGKLVEQRSSSGVANYRMKGL